MTQSKLKTYAVSCLSCYTTTLGHYSTRKAANVEAASHCRLYSHQTIITPNQTQKKEK